MRIVVVEDEMCIREGLVKLLERIDRAYLVVGQADNGKSGLELIKESKPDLVITDVQMPIMDGLEMLRCLQEKQPLPKVIILSAYSEFSYAQQAIKLGVSEYLIKPIIINELTQSLRSIEQQLAEESNKKGRRRSCVPWKRCLAEFNPDDCRLLRKLEIMCIKNFQWTSMEILF